MTGPELRRRRERLRLSQTQLAQRILPVVGGNVSTLGAMISAIELGTTRATRGRGRAVRIAASRALIEADIALPPEPAEAEAAAQPAPAAALVVAPSPEPVAEASADDVAIALASMSPDFRAGFAFGRLYERSRGGAR